MRRNLFIISINLTPLALFIIMFNSSLDFFWVDSEFFIILNLIAIIFFIFFSFLLSNLMVSQFSKYYFTFNLIISMILVLSFGGQDFISKESTKNDTRIVISAVDGGAFSTTSFVKIQKIDNYLVFFKKRSTLLIVNDVYKIEPYLIKDNSILYNIELYDRSKSTISVNVN